MSLRAYFEQRAREGSWGGLYDGKPDAASYNFLTRRAAVEKLLAGDPPYAQVLDAGCGTGDYAELAARHGWQSYLGVDFATGMVAEAWRRTADLAVPARFAVGAGASLPCRDDAFDLVLALGYIAYFADPRPAIEEIRRVLRPGGTLVMQVAKPDLVGWLDRAVIDRVRAVVRGPRPTPPTPPGWVNIRYSGPRLDRMLGAAGFVRTARTFNHFIALPAFLRQRHPQLYIRLSERMTRRPAWWRALAVNYIGKYRLAADPGRGE